MLKFLYVIQDLVGNNNNSIVNCIFYLTKKVINLKMAHNQWHTQEFCLGGGVQQIQLRTEDRENGDLGAVAP